MNTFDTLYWRHQAESHIASITKEQRPCDGLGEADLDVPQALFGKACPFCKCLGASPFGLERLALHANRADWRVNSRMAQCLENRRRGGMLLLGALSAGLRLVTETARVDAAACGAFG